MRRFVLEQLLNSQGLILALIVSSILFSILHFNITQLLSSFIAGLVSGLLYFYTRNLSTCVLAHVLYSSLDFYNTQKENYLV